MVITDLSFKSSAVFILSNNNVEFNVSWTEGTDVRFEVDFDDGSTFSWDWDSGNHRLSYGLMNVTFDHVFNAIKNHTISLRAYNDLSDQTMVICDCI